MNHIFLANKEIGNPVTPEDFEFDDYNRIALKIKEAFENVDESVGPNHNPRSNFVGCLLRTAGHDFMDFRVEYPERGGSDGCINFEDEDNMGLEKCLTSFNIVDIYHQVADRVSLADFFVIAAEAATARAATDYNPNDFFAPGTLAFRFRNGFKFGRKTAIDCAWNIGFMPNPEDSCGQDSDSTAGLQQIFVDNIFAGRKDAWTLTAAISGAHTVGSAKKDNSGYEGFWSNQENAGIFNNDYFSSIILKGWAPEKAMNGNENKNQWQLADFNALNESNERKEHKELMLNTDMCLAYTNTAFADCLHKKYEYENA